MGVLEQWVGAWMETCFEGMVVVVEVTGGIFGEGGGLGDQLRVFWEPIHA